MALVKTGTFGSSPSAYYEIHADYLSGSGNTRQIKVHMALKVNGSTSQSRYGYPLNWNPIIHTSGGGWHHVKGNEMWYATDGLRWYSWTYTIDVGTTSAVNIDVGFDLKRSDGGSTSWNTSQRGSFYVGGTNTAPSMSGEVTIQNWDSNGSVLNGVIPENVSQLYLTWNTGWDNEQGAGGLKYGVNEIVDGGGSSTILYPTTNNWHTVNIGAGNEGQRRKYFVDCRDNSDALSNAIYSVEVTKNNLTSGAFTGHSNNIDFNTESFRVFFNKGHNTDGSPAHSLIYSDHVTIQNMREVSGGEETISIWRGGDIPANPYIRFDDLKNYFAGSNYNGSLHIGLRTRNNYETYRWAGGAVSVDLRTTPTPAQGQDIASTPELSSMYKRVEFSGNYYFIPDGSSCARVHWNAGAGKLGEEIRYEVYISYGDGSWQKVADVGNNGGYHYYDHIIPKQGSAIGFKYMIRTITGYGYHSDVVTSAQTLHYYNTPSLSTGTITRGATTCDILVTVNVNSSIPNIGIRGSWERFAKGTSSPVQQSGNLTITQNEQVINLTDLTDEGQYDLKITYNDNTGFSSDKQGNISIGANSPIFFVNKHGIGVGGEKATSDYSLISKGNANVIGALKVNGSDVLTGNNANLQRFMVYGQENIYYPVLIEAGSHGYSLGKFSISRYYSWEAPNSWHNSTHKGGLTLTFNWTGDTSWGGNYQGITVTAFHEQYCNMVAGLRNTTSGVLVWLRGGGALYQLDSSFGKDTKVTVHHEGFTDSGGSNFSVLDNLSNQASEIFNKFHNRSDGTVFDNNLRVYSPHNKPTAFDVGALRRDTDDWTPHIFETHGGFSVGSNSLSDRQGDDTPWYGLGRVNRGNGHQDWVKCSGYWGVELRSASQRVSVEPNNTGVMIANDYGYARIGCRNGGFFHVETDRDSFYFNKQVHVQGSVLHGENYNNNYCHGTFWKIQGFDSANGAYMHTATHTGAFGIDWWASDIKLKNEVIELDGKNNYLKNVDKNKISKSKDFKSISGLETINKIEHFSYKMNKDDSLVKCGYIANQLQEIDESFVMEVAQEPTVKGYDEEKKEIIDLPNPMYFEEEPIIRNPKTSSLIPFITKAIQELSKENEELKNRLKAIEEKLEP